MSVSGIISPHVRDAITIEKIMWYVALALLPLVVIGTYYFGIHALLVVIITVAAAIITEAVIQKIRKVEITVMDGTAVVTGLILGLSLPPTVPLWLPIVGGFVAIFIGKAVFGGLAQNIFNPALVGRAFLVVSWPVLMTTWIFDGITRATPLSIAKMQGMDSLVSGFGSKTALYKSLLFGNIGGTIGETSALAILIIGLFLIWKKIIDWKLPAAYLGTIFIFSWILGRDPIFHILAGAAFFAAIFMITEYVTAPITGKGRIIYASLAGILTVIIRLYSGFPGGVTFAILLVNALTPLIDRFTKPRRFGT